MVTKVFLDAETLPPDQSDPLPGCESGSRTEEEVRQLALNPQFGRILCIGLIVERDGEIITRGVLGRDRATGRFHLNEARILRAFWKLIRDFDARRDLLIGFNILDFDLHFICTRSVIRRVRPSINVCFARYRQSPVYDVMWEFCHWRHRISLDELAKILGLRSSKQGGVNGGRVYDLFLEGRHEEIANYCLDDVELTRLIYRRLNFIGDTDEGGSGPCSG
ncbi:MAG: ribonuclease H-like domain-containing protein [Acidobacteria bacterium]|nr:ribonuclease H-like domain-containing protein [Acidobacteriota bacterium]